MTHRIMAQRIEPMPRTIARALCGVGLMLAGIAGVSAANKPADAPITYTAPFVAHAPIIDGDGDDAQWNSAAWRDIRYLIVGKPLSGDRDFVGRYKVVWTAHHLYLMAEIDDDLLIDSHPDPLDRYWEDDTLEIFVDEDNSGGPHQFSNNAFAYHIALDNQAVDIAPFSSEAERRAGKPNVRTYPQHVQSRWKRSERSPHTIVWEVRLTLYPDSEASDISTTRAPAGPVALTAGKVIGFMVSYCDSDGPGGRDHFLSDIDVPAVNGDKNRGYIDANVFGTLRLEKTKR
jgi:hypothetical protein